MRESDSTLSARVWRLVASLERSLELVGTAHFQRLQLHRQGLRCLLGVFESRHRRGFSGFQSTPTREMPGMASLRSSSLLPLRPARRFTSPVTLPPGRAKEATNPFPTGSASDAMTIGIVLVAFLAARVTLVPSVTMISTFSWTSSPASLGTRSSLPSA